MWCHSATPLERLPWRSFQSNRANRNNQEELHIRQTYDIFQRNVNACSRATSISFFEKWSPVLPTSINLQNSIFQNQFILYFSAMMLILQLKGLIFSQRQGVEGSRIMHEPMLKWSDLPEVSRKKTSKNQRLFFKETENVRTSGPCAQTHPYSPT